MEVGHYEPSINAIAPCLRFFCYDKKMSITFRSIQPGEESHLPKLFITALQTVYPDFTRGEWTNDLDDIPGNYLNSGDVIVGLDGNDIVAMGALKKVDDNTCEMKRVAIAPDYQSRGLGQELLKAIESRAIGLRYKHMILDTTIKQVAAQRLYEKNHYKQTDRKIVDHPAGYPLEIIFYEKDLV